MQTSANILTISEELIKLVTPSSDSLFRCTQCQGVAINHRRCTNNSCTGFFCGFCVATWTSCPLCHSANNSSHDPLIESWIVETIKNSDARCNVCLQTFKFQEITAHLSICKKPCEKCGATLSYASVGTHASLCPEEIIKCIECNHQMIRKDETLHKQNHCQETTLMCSCGTFFKRKDQKSHLELHQTNLKTVDDDLERLNNELGIILHTIETTKKKKENIESHLRIEPQVRLNFSSPGSKKSYTTLKHDIPTHSLSFKDAAVKVLRDNGGSLHVNDIMSRITEQKLVHTTGQTPDKTLGAILYDSPLFKLTAPATFTLHELVEKNSPCEKSKFTMIKRSDV
jgi:hypothetical protein